MKSWRVWQENQMEKPSRTAKLGPRPGTGFKPGGDSQTLRKEIVPLTLIEDVTVENGKALIGMTLLGAGRGFRKVTG